MHSIKKAARREAWFDSDPDNKTYNPFGRIGNRGPRRPSDIEQGALQHRRTDGDVQSPSQEQRLLDGRADGIQKSGTFPTGPGDHLPNHRQQELAEGISPYAPLNGGQVNGSDGEKTATQPEPAPPAAGETHQPVGAEGARKRKSRKFLPWKKDETGADMERTNTSLSQKKKFPKLSIMSQIRAVFGSWINIMLVFVPVGIALEYAHVNKILVFIMNFLAIIPLAAMLSYATEELAMYIGETLGGLLNATFGNAVELIVSIIALTQGKILIVQTSLIGSMLSNLLLVLGMCFYFGGMRREEQYFNLTVAQTASSLLSLAIGSLIIPTAFVSFANVDKGATPASRGTAVMLLFVYGAYLIFQLHTHATMYNEPSRKSPKKPSNRRGVGEMTRSLAHMGAGTGSAKAHEAEKQAERPKEDEAANQEDQEEEETPQLTVLGAIITLAGSTVLIALCAEYMVSSINEVAKSVSPEFIGLILLPIVGNAAEHATAVTVAIKDKMDLAIGVAVGSSLQIALLVLPFMVCLNWWGVGSPAVLSLSFDGFQVCVLFIAVILVK